MSARSIAYWSALPLVLIASAAGACQICIPFPERTLADRLLASAAVVLAREDAERPFHYRVTEVLSGTPHDSAIDLFLNSQARRTLAAVASKPHQRATRTNGTLRELRVAERRSITP